MNWLLTKGWYHYIANSDISSAVYPRLPSFPFIPHRKFFTAQHSPAIIYLRRKLTTAAPVSKLWCAVQTVLVSSSCAYLVFVNSKYNVPCFSDLTKKKVPDYNFTWYHWHSASHYLVQIWNLWKNTDSFLSSFFVFHWLQVIAPAIF